MTRRTLLAATLAALTAILAIACELIPPAPPADIVLSPGFYHLGNDPAPDWQEASTEPDGTARLLAKLQGLGATLGILGR